MRYAVSCVPLKFTPSYFSSRYFRDESNIQRLLLRGIPDEHTAHIRALVDQQKTNEYVSKLYSPQNMLSSATKRPVSNFIQSKIVTLLDDYPSGLPIDSFDDAYADKYGKKLNPLLIGFTSVKQIVEAISDVVSYKYVDDVLMLSSKKQTATAVTNFASRTNISEQLKHQIFSVLMKFNHCGGLYAARLTTEYENMFKTSLDFQTLGYSSVVEMMSKVSDIVDIERPTPDGDFFLVPKMCVIDSTRGVIDRTNYQYRTLPCEVTSQLLGIQLTYVINPSLFWFQLTQYSDELASLMEKLNGFYNSYEKDFVLPRECVVCGHPCVARLV